MSFLESDRVRGLLERAGLGGLQPRSQKAVLLLAAIAIGVGLWRFWPAAPAPEVGFVDNDGAANTAPEGVAASDADAPEAADIVVHVVGAVASPGVYTLAPGSRVVDAIEAAGGGVGNAALGSLNLARILADGEQVYVFTTEEIAAGAAAPSAAAASTSAAGSSAGDVIDLNTATAAELDSLPGIGPSTAQKIVDDRELNGPFAAPEDLMRVPGIGAKKFDGLKDLVTCG